MIKKLDSQEFIPDFVYVSFYSVPTLRATHRYMRRSEILHYWFFPFLKEDIAFSCHFKDLPAFTDSSTFWAFYFRHIYQIEIDIELINISLELLFFFKLSYISFCNFVLYSLLCDLKVFSFYLKTYEISVEYLGSHTRCS